MTAAGPSADLSTTIRRLAETDAGDLPLLSVHLDTRPHATGQRPAERASLVLLRDRLREIGRSLPARGPLTESFREDAERIGRFVEDDLDPSTQGLALFACHGIGLWEAVQVGVPFLDHVAVGPRPDLFQLVRLVDELETAVVALVDTNTVRLFVSRLGTLEEREGPDDDSASYRKRQVGGWSQARYQRHIDAHIADFARTAAAVIEDLVQAEDATWVVLAGDEVAITPLRGALSDQVRGRVVDVLREDIRVERDGLQDAVHAVVARVEAEQGRDLADLVLAAVRAGGLGVAGVRETHRALEAAAVETLVLLTPAVPAPEKTAYQDARDLATEVEDPDDPTAPDTATRAELVRRATLTGARVEVLEQHDGLARFGGVGALLRFPLG